MFHPAPCTSRSTPTYLLQIQVTLCVPVNLLPGLSPVCTVGSWVGCVLRCNSPPLVTPHLKRTCMYHPGLSVCLSVPYHTPRETEPQLNTEHPFQAMPTTTTTGGLPTYSPPGMSARNAYTCSPYTLSRTGPWHGYSKRCMLKPT